MPLAVVATDVGDWRKVLQVQQVAELEASDGLLKVQVLAAGLCFPDVLTVEGKHVMKKTAPFTPGNEISGRVVAISKEDAEESGLKVGDVVFGTCATGGMAEYALVPTPNAYKVPEGVDPSLVAGFEVNYGTAYHGLVDIAKMKEGETVLVLGASGGVGLAAVDLCKALGAKVVACASTSGKLAVCKKAGADVLINYVEGGGGNFKKALKEAGVYGDIDIVWDPVGGKFTEPAVRSLAFGGRLVVVGFASGGANPKSAIPKLPLNLALLNEREILGCLWGGWKMRDGNEQNTHNVQHMMRLIEEGKLKPIVSHECSFDDFSEGFAAIMNRRAVGKINFIPKTSHKASSRL